MYRGINKLVTLVLVIILLFGVLPVFNNVEAVSQGFSLVSYVWGSTQNPQKVYPGSSDVILILQLINNFPFKIDSIVGNLSLPNGFTDVYGHSSSVAVGVVEDNYTVRNYIYPGELFRLSYILNIGDTLSPGTYYGNLSLNYTYYNSSSNSVVTSTYVINDVPLIVSDFPVFTFSVKKVLWLGDGVEVNATPGARDLSLHIYVRNLGGESIDDLWGSVDLSPPFYPRESMVHYGGVGKNSVFELVFNDIDIEYGYPPGIYYETLILNFSFRGYGDAVKHYNYSMVLPLRLDNSEYAGVEVVRVSWNGFIKVYPGSRRVYLKVTLENMGRFTLSDIYAVGNLPPGFSSELGKGVINATVDGVYRYGDFIDIVFGPLYINSTISSGIYYMDIDVRGVGSIGGSSLIVEQSITVPMIISNYSSMFDVVSVEWLYEGQPAFALPGSRDITLLIKVAYRGEEEISGVSPTLLLPPGFTIKEVKETPQAVSPSNIFTLSFVLDASRVLTPKYYSAHIHLEYVLSVNNLNTIVSSNITFPIKISDPDVFNSRIRVVNFYWGVGVPKYVYPATEDNPFTVAIINYGPYDIRGASLSIQVPPGFTVHSRNVTLTNLLIVGSSSETTFYISVGKSLEAGSYNFNLTISYIIDLYGVEIEKHVVERLSVEIVDTPFPQPYIKVLSYQWENGYRVYPGTEKARLAVSLENDAPFSISAIHIYPMLPEGFSMSEGSVMFYVDGPITPWGSFSFPMMIDVGRDVKPGYYHIELSMDYLLNSGGDGVEINESLDILVHVDKLGGIRYLFYRWIGYSPGPGSAGSSLTLVFRNDLFNVMNGLYATILLPEGFKSAYTGLSTVNVTPYLTSSLNGLSRFLSGQNIEFNLGQSSLSKKSVSRGDYIILSVPVIISPDLKVGSYEAMVILNFLDEWSMVREYQLRCPFNLPGSVNYVEVVENRSRLVVGSRETNVSIVLRNPGTSPMYDVYVGISSFSQVVAFSSSIKHIVILPPGEEAELVWRASVLPTTSFVGGLPALITISYVDSVGVKHLLNQTIILYVEGLARLKIIDVYVEPETPYAKSLISVSATIVNVGSDVAKNTEVYLMGENLLVNADSYTFLGDIDTGTQIPFTLYGVLNASRGETTFYLIIKYSNLFNEEATIRYPITVKVGVQPKETESSSPVTLIEDYWKIIVIGAVLIFLVLSGFLIHRMYIASKSRLEMG